MSLQVLVVAFTAGCIVLALMTERILRKGTGRRRPFFWAAWALGVVLVGVGFYGVANGGYTQTTVGWGFRPTVMPIIIHGIGPAAKRMQFVYSQPGPRTVIFGPVLSSVRANNTMVPVALLIVAGLAGLLPRLSGRWARIGAELRRPLPYGRVEMRPWRWAWLLLPALAMGGSMLGVNWADGGTALAGAAVLALATVALLRWPAIAADVGVVGLLAVGVGDLAQAVLWPSHVLTSAVLAGNGVIVLSARETAVLAGIEGVLLIGFGLWLAPRTVSAHVRARLHPDPALTQRVRRLTETRAVAVSSAAAELRRVERDLHDGAQARLVALGMNLRAVERLLPEKPQAALALVAEAREFSARALNDLRDVIRGICPPILADRGLGDAVRALAMDTPLGTDVEVDLPGRLEAPVETACYFAVAEALTNAVRHAHARNVNIRVTHADGMLRIEVTDDGTGGADPDAGTGLAGIEKRLASFDGILAISSPVGGPTMIVMEVPCALSSQKIYSC